MEAKLTEFVKRLKDAGRNNLNAVVLYGSAVTGEFRVGSARDSRRPRESASRCGMVDPPGKSPSPRLHHG
jgi:hypothetical protein